jgi:hypothetical protein
MTVVRMFGGFDVDLLNPDLSMISIGSIFRTLSVLPRYNGQTCRPYTVLEHSIRGAEAYADRGEIRQARAFLMHDAHEAFIGDITTPVSQAAEIQDQLMILKTRLDEAIDYKFKAGLFRYHREIEAMDRAMFQREWADLMWNRDTAPLDMDVSRITKDEVPRTYLLPRAMELWERWSK